MVQIFGIITQEAAHISPKTTYSQALQQADSSP